MIIHWFRGKQSGSETVVDGSRNAKGAVRPSISTNVVAVVIGVTILTLFLVWSDYFPPFGHFWQAHSMTAALVSNVSLALIFGAFTFSVLDGRQRRHQDQISGSINFAMAQQCNDMWRRLLGVIFCAPTYEAGVPGATIEEARLVEKILFDCKLEPLARDHSPFNLVPEDIYDPLQVYVPVLALRREWIAILYRTITEARRSAYAAIVRSAPLSFHKGPLDGYLTQMHEVAIALDEIQNFLTNFKGMSSEEWLPTEQWRQSLVQQLNETLVRIREARLYYHSHNKRPIRTEIVESRSQTKGSLDNDE